MTELEALHALTRLCTDKAEKDVVGVLKLLECPYRVRSRDGNAMVGTRDLNPTRLNLVVVDGIVTAVHLG